MALSEVWLALQTAEGGVDAEAGEDGQHVEEEEGRNVERTDSARESTWRQAATTQTTTYTQGQQQN